MDFSIEYQDLVSIIISIICGGIIGFEREFRNKSTGFRTIVLICLGSTLFTIVSRYGDGSDDRISANIITGIGFIGAGVIFKDKLSVLGLTTAAVIWTTAAIGMAVGIGYYGIALIFTVLTFIILSLVTRVERLIENLQKNKTVNINFRDGDCASLSLLEEKIKANRLKSKTVQISKHNNTLNAVLQISGTKENMDHLNEIMMNMPEITDFF
ncbi:putative Mg2+ transporter-C (MgtC) family protein [Arcticibacter tournemirensis]|uniref:MgtC/SapB family protein n=1 Tax=Arcticibacter tournemirensis TaxID=699437 RepID=A0A5M9GWM4_9SPHI|nr:MgtC/SapB family protein [Arcticibacter tournemirensis]KAA8477208.1 MgtC/SapB family protein [Arcticibacter tournemirensis]TQM50207.1 putative Mg2+ transporter-C (MgtC) family protein [Arcticibacter tournemirensis]